jgi:phosphoribosylamine--glycine ligase
MKVLIVGSGGREHALAWKVSQSDAVDEVIAAPGNEGIAAEPKSRVAPLDPTNIVQVRDFALHEKVDLTIIGPEAPLVGGMADVLRASGLSVFGPSKTASTLEGSKAFAKDLMKKQGIPTARSQTFESYPEAQAHLRSYPGPVVLKADGLAAGKGVLVCNNRQEATEALNHIMKDKAFGSAGDRVVIEDYLQGEEASFIAVTDGTNVLPLASSQDHKPVFDGGRGPNTGGMGAYSPAPVITAGLHDKIMDQVMIPTVEALRAQGSPYVGFLYAGLIIEGSDIKVLEFNCRLGDPEAQPLLYRMKSDLIPLLMAATRGELQGHSLEWEALDSVCVVMASEGYPGAYEKNKPIDGIDEAESLGDVKVFHAGTSVANGQLVTAGGRVLGVTGRAPSISQAVSKAYAAVARISWEGVHFRKDIAHKALSRS